VIPFHVPPPPPPLDHMDSLAVAALDVKFALARVAELESPVFAARTAVFMATLAPWAASLPPEVVDYLQRTPWPPLEEEHGNGNGSPVAPKDGRNA